MPIQEFVMGSFYANGHPLSGTTFTSALTGCASSKSDGYQPYLADLTWPLVTEFLERELVGSAL